MRIHWPLLLPATLSAVLLSQPGSRAAEPTAPPPQAALADADAAPAKEAFERWLVGTLGVAAGRYDVVVAAIEQDAVVVKFSAGGLMGREGTARIRRDGSQWVTHRIFDAGPGVWIYPEAFVHDFRHRMVRGTMGEMRTLANGVESYSIDNNQYPVTPDLAELARVLEPVYMGKIPRRDGWGRDLRYVSTPGEYCIVSLAGDGLPDVPAASDVGSLRTPPSTGNGASHDIAKDLVFCMGGMVSWFE